MSEILSNKDSTMSSTDIPNQLPSIPTYFAEREIFITGGTGFMGKVLIEKLLRSCPQIKNIYMLMRCRKQDSIQERLRKLLELPLFDRLREEYPENLKKLIPINGDVCELGLNISPEDRQRMENVSMIFHSAASVRFDDPLNEAVIMNTRGTREVMLYAETLKNLHVVVHVSTTYSNPWEPTVSEKLYPPNADWKTTIRLAEEYPEILNTLTAKYTNYEPNTYTFTKGLAEQVVNDFRQRLPIIVYRPSIVTSAMDEPIPGWVDNFNGPIGLMMACGIGILRTSYGDPDVVSDFTPVDTSIKAMIVAAWYRCVEPINKNDSIPVYNCSTSLQRKITTGFIVEMGKELTKNIPFDNTVWVPGGHITKCKYNNYIKFLTTHLCAAYIMDIALRITGNIPFMVKLQRRIYFANCALQIFIRTSWIFENHKFLGLHAKIPTADLSTFGYDNFITADVSEYLANAVLGVRRYLLKQPDKNLPAAKRLYKRLAILDFTLKLVIYLLVGYFLMKKLGILYLFGI